MYTELGKVEVQRCILSWAGPVLRSQYILSWDVGKELGEESRQKAWRRVGKTETKLKININMAEEKLEEE